MLLFCIYLFYQWYNGGSAKGALSKFALTQENFDNVPLKRFLTGVSEAGVLSFLQQMKVGVHLRSLDLRMTRYEDEVFTRPQRPCMFD